MVKLVSLIGLIVLLTLGIAKPFIGHHDWNGVFYSQIARNYLKDGLETGLGQMTSPGNYYTHYPPLFTWLLALDFKFLGVSDVSARLLPVMLTIFSFILLVKITDSLVPLLLALTPMIRYFSQMPSQEALIIFLSLLVVYFYRQKRARALLWTVAALGWSGWAGYFLIPLLWLHAKFFTPKFKPVLLKAGAILVGTFGLHLLHTYLLTGSLTGGGIFDALLLRLNLYPALGRVEPELAGQFKWLNYLVKEFHTLNIYYTSTVLLLAGLGIAKLKRSFEAGLVLMLLAWGVTYPLIFSNVTFVHEYFNLFFWPGLALAISYLFKHGPHFAKATWGKLLLLILAVVVFKERLPFLNALKSTAAFKPGYELGRQVNQNSGPGETVNLSADEDFIDVQGIFVEYYADRVIIWDNSHND